MPSISINTSQLPFNVPRALAILVFFHIAIIAISNYLVQFPLKIFGFGATWGVFSFPFIFLATDLTVRLLGKSPARKVIFFAMIPAFIVSYYVSMVFYQGQYVGHTGLSEFNSVVFRICIASFTAYVVGQMLDILIFDGLRKLRAWWVAPFASTVIGNLIDTFWFYAVAFYQGSDEFMAANWVEIAMLDYSFKLIISVIIFLPIYGVIINNIMKRIK